MVAGGDSSPPRGPVPQRSATRHHDPTEPSRRGLRRTRMLDLARLRRIVLVVGMLVGAAAAQCATQWRPGSGIHGTDGDVLASTLWDPDGPGPRAPLLVVGGGFRIAGTASAANVATYDPVTRQWGALGTGLLGLVYDFAVVPGGDLVAAGSFLLLGVVGTQNVARWNGSVWTPLGSGTDGAVFDLAVLQNGDLIAGGNFTQAGGVACNHVARWNGSSWAPLGAGTDASVTALAVLPNGHLAAGGLFDTAGGLPVEYCALWNGSAWLPMPGGPNSYVFAFAVAPNGDLLAGGLFGAVGGVPAPGVARWNGSAWSPMAAGVPFAVQELLVEPGGTVLAVGYVPLVGAPEPLVARWNGVAWAPFAGGPDTGLVETVAVLPGGDLAVGGTFTLAGSSEQRTLARFDGSAWSVTNPGTDGDVTAIAAVPGGGCYAAGSFTSIDGVAARHVARWNGSQWSPLGTGTNFPPAALLVLPNGDLVVGGNFTQAGGVTANGIARWNGSAWSAFGSGMNGYGVRALALLPDGSLVAGGDFDIAGGQSARGVARWNGSAWLPLGSGVDDRVNALAVLADGTLAVGGRFVQAGPWQANRVALWTGQGWSPCGAGPQLGTDGEVFALLADPAGGMVVGGDFQNASGVATPYLARWQPTTQFEPLPGPQGIVRALQWLPGGDLAVGGTFQTLVFGGTTWLPNHLARWDGTAWSVPGAAIGAVPGADASVRALAVAADGDLLAGGDFTVVTGRPSRGFARLTTTCPAAVVTAGVGCQGPGGWNQLEATSLPWTGGTFRSRAAGMPAGGLALAITSTSAWLYPLHGPFAEALPGCEILLWPDLIFDLHLPTTNAIDIALAIPDTSLLAGVQLHQQVFGFVLTPAGTFASVTSSNALRLLLGTF